MIILFVIPLSVPYIFSRLHSLVRLDGNTTKRKSVSEAAQDDQFEGGSTQKLILQLSWALDMYRMLLTQTVIDWAVNLNPTNPEEPPFAIEPEVMALNLKQDAINSQHLKISNASL